MTLARFETITSATAAKQIVVERSDVVRRVTGVHKGSDRVLCATIILALRAMLMGLVTFAKRAAIEKIDFSKSILSEYDPP